MPESIPRITLDFSNTDDDGLLFARLARATVPLVEGMDLIAGDDEGHECRVRVARIDGPLAYLVPDWESWTLVPVPPTTTIAAMVGAFEDIAAEVGGNGSSVRSQQSTNLVPSP